MRKIAMMVMLLATAWGSMVAQNADDYDYGQGFKRGIFNHLSVNAGVGLEGISIGVAAPVTNFLEIEGGVSMIPAIKPTFDLNIPSQTVTVTQNGVSATIDTPDAKVKTEGNFKRTMGHIKAYVYPFGGSSKFFIVGGLSFGGKEIAKVQGYSDDLKKFAAQYPDYTRQILDAVGANLSGYNLKLNDDFKINGDVRCKNVRPYIGLGFGRTVPKNRIGFRFESGVQYMGTLKVYQDDQELDLDQILRDATGDDTVSKIVKNFKFYPCIKFSIIGRLL